MENNWIQSCKYLPVEQGWDLSEVDETARVQNWRRQSFSGSCKKASPYTLCRPRHLPGLVVVLILLWSVCIWSKSQNGAPLPESHTLIFWFNKPGVGNEILHVSNESKWTDYRVHVLSWYLAFVHAIHSALKVLSFSFYSLWTVYQCLRSISNTAPFIIAKVPTAGV